MAYSGVSKWTRYSSGFADFKLMTKMKLRILKFFFFEICVNGWSDNSSITTFLVIFYSFAALK